MGMKGLLLTILLVAASAAAEEYTTGIVEKIIDARIAVLQEESTQLDSAIVILDSASLSEGEQYELIARGAFHATEQRLATFGLTLKQLYFLEEKYGQERAEWLEGNAEQATMLAMLEERVESLQMEFDRIAATTASE
jgi:uncharacterized small protein (DUF1192 family)